MGLITRVTNKYYVTILAVGSKATVPIATIPMPEPRTQQIRVCNVVLIRQSMLVVRLLIFR